MAKPLINKDIFFMPKLASDKAKRSRVKNIRQSRRSALRNSSSPEEKRSIRDRARNQIRSERGGRSQVSEVFSHVQDFAGQLNQLKSNVMNTNVGRIATLGKSIIGNISSPNPSGLVENVRSASDIVSGKSSKKSGYNCKCS